MFEFLQSTAELAGHITVLSVALATAWAVVRRPWRAVRTALEQVDTMSKALGPNGGKSLADEIRRQGEMQRSQGLQLNHTVAAVDSLCDVIEKCIFQTDSTGAWVRINRTFTLTFGYPMESVRGMGWVNAINPADREDFIRDWEHAVADQRSFRRQVGVVTRDDRLVVAMVQARPTLGTPDVGKFGWFGTIEIVSVKTQYDHAEAPE